MRIPTRRSARVRTVSLVALAAGLAACGPNSSTGDVVDVSSDASDRASVTDTQGSDVSTDDTATIDAMDASLDTGADADIDAGMDSGPTDSGPGDTGPTDTGPRDTGGGDTGGGTRGLRIAGNRIQRDGANFNPRGFNMIGVLTPDACTNAPGAGPTARASFGMAELSAARNEWHANVVRLQVSQRGMDPMDSLHNAAYVQRVQNGVALARTLGFSVIVSMQDQSIGCGMAHGLPTAATQRSWRTVVPLFRDDPYVMFELFNEPDNDPTTAGWAEWRDGGRSPIDLGEAAIGHQALVDLVRSLGATNILIADGANKAGKLQGVPILHDTLSPPQIAYGLHPYYFHTSNTATLAADTANWDTRFGYLTATVPVLATEWNASASCFTGQAARVPDFFAYLTSHHIGLFGHAFDVRNTMVQNLTAWTPTTFTGCSAGSDAGELVQGYFGTLGP